MKSSEFLYCAVLFLARPCPKGGALMGYAAVYLERVHARVGREAEGEEERISSGHSAEHRTRRGWGSVSRPRDHDLS